MTATPAAEERLGVWFYQGPGYPNQTARTGGRREGGAGILQMEAEARRPRLRPGQAGAPLRLGLSDHRPVLVLKRRRTAAVNR